MAEQSRSVIIKNLANVISLLGVLPVCVLFLDDGYEYIIPLIIFNNVMDDLDGIVAVKLRISSAFGAALDNVCDIVAHTVFALMIGMHFGWICGVLSLAAATAMLIRVVSRIVPGAAVGTGSPTNELMRHMLFVLLLVGAISIDGASVLAVVFALHTVSLLVPFRMPGLIRSLTKSAVSIGLVNVALVVAWRVPQAAVVIAGAFGSTYLYGLTIGAYQWYKGARPGVPSTS
ncbi:MAG: CDP-alcohol phosphatidyltransferase family protein [Planctomycetota bacterium]|nr:CDP-alcohol phosphatidyltransferase family protein [Planctomycetota bacterium]